ncbi:Bgt-20700 [Blumeria graminis f. sp. tritici]|uniref:Bgt-20700 n=2 Tax=Blumeria graminis f. sp. tritici TaxID=62690 RepID=A0A9X9QG58_BLUGR|nr:Bgt-20700 [Blumeria graminis f. sp. tritici]
MFCLTLYFINSTSSTSGSLEYENHDLVLLSFNRPGVFISQLVYSFLYLPNRFLSAVCFRRSKFTYILREVDILSLPPPLANETKGICRCMAAGKSFKNFWLRSSPTTTPRLCLKIKQLSV